MNAHLSSRNTSASTVAMPTDLKLKLTLRLALWGHNDLVVVVPDSVTISGLKRMLDAHLGGTGVDVKIFLRKDRPRPLADHITLRDCDLTGRRRRRIDPDREGNDEIPITLFYDYTPAVVGCPILAADNLFYK